jgi:hypothetical protein
VAKGTLLRKQEWKIASRQNPIDTIESESRILALSSGRYMVQANHTLLFYDSEGNLLKQHQLGPGMWGVQSEDNGEELVIRHVTDGRTVYHWVEPDSMRVKAEYWDDSPNRSQIGLLAVRGALIDIEKDGLRSVSNTGNERLLCSSELCRAPAVKSAYPTDRGVVVMSRFGACSISLEQGVLWAKRTPSSGFDQIKVGPAIQSISGRRFGLFVYRGRKYREFDGIKLTQPAEIFVYDAENPNALTILPGAAEDAAISPSNTRLATLNDAQLKLYDLVPK